jgi:hypothetical protein
VPELGLACVFAGGLGYVAWLALEVVQLRGGAPGSVKGMMLAGLACTCLGAVCLGIGSARIYRPGMRWTRVLVVALGESASQGGPESVR